MSCPTDAPTAPSSPTYGWTPERKALFLDRLAAHGNVRAACRQTGLSAESAYKLRRRDPLFARGWAAAVVLGRDASIQALAERAVEGVEEEIYYRGELIGTRRRYDSRLLLAHLARLDQLADEEAAGTDVGRFDLLLAAVAADEKELLDDDRETTIKDAQNEVVVEHLHHEMAAFFESPEAKAGDCQPGQLPDELKDKLYAECEDLAERARAAAAEDWDARQAVAIAAVDALGMHPDVLADLPNRPLPLGAITGLMPSETGRAVSFPCTLSTASTAALARTLVEPPPGWATRPRSPFSAPRTISGIK